VNERSRRGGLAAFAAGCLVAIAIIGPAIWDGVWLALAPATALLIPAAFQLHAAWRPRDGWVGAVGSRILVAAAAALLTLAMVGATVTATEGMEPGWLASLEIVAGYALIAGAFLFGLAALRTRRVPKWAAVTFAVSLPLGLGIDSATNAFPFGELFFFAGYGFYVGLGLFALSLMRLGLAARATMSPTAQESEASFQT
jgi:hypothetical protein